MKIPILLAKNCRIENRVIARGDAAKSIAQVSVVATHGRATFRITDAGGSIGEQVVSSEGDLPVSVSTWIIGKESTPIVIELIAGKSGFRGAMVLES